MEYQIGQRLMVAPESFILTKDFAQLLEKYHIGNIIIYKYNYKNKKQLYDLIINCQNLSLKSKYNIPMFVSTDQEGGWIAHLTEGFTIPPSQQALGRKNNRYYVYMAGKIMASELQTVGVNVNFAPVVDLALNKKNWIIGPRSYSPDPDIVVELAAEFIKAHFHYNVLPVIKHYPGLGRNKEDPHVSQLTNKMDYRTLQQQDLKPFNELIKSYENGLMVGNISVPAIVRYMSQQDEKNYKKYIYTPALISPIIVKEYLIKKNNFYGLIFSDELNIPAIKNVMPIEEAVYQSLKSGIDIALVSEPPQKTIQIINYLKKKYMSDNDFRLQTIRSVKKILHDKLIIFKEKNKAFYFSKKSFDIPLFKKNYNSLHYIHNQDLQHLNHIISLNTTEIIKDEENIIPLLNNPKIKDKHFIIISHKDSVYKECQKYLDKNITHIKIGSYLKKNIPQNEINSIVQKIDTDSIILVTLMSAQYDQLIKALYKKNKHIIILNLLHCYALKNLNYIKTIVCCYSDNEAQIKPAIEFIFKKTYIKDDQIIKQYMEL